ncbi:MAG: universal stress protein, partial [Pseudomonadota bacterium]
MRKFMVVVDDTPECQQAMRYAARRASRTGGGVLMLYVIPPEEFQHWMGVAEVMRAEGRERAEARLSELAEELRALSGITPEFSIREGHAVEEVLDAIREDSE